MAVNAKAPSRESIKKNQSKLSNNKGKFSKTSSHKKRPGSRKRPKNGCNRCARKNKRCLIIAAAIGFAIILLIFIIMMSVRNSGANNKDFQFSEKCANIHNVLRAKHSAPPVYSDSGMVEFAASRAAKLVQIDQMVHLPDNRGYGENIFVIWGALSDCNTVTQAWYNEFEQYKFDFNNPGYSAQTGHATQVVWVDTRRIGCAQRGFIRADSTPKQYTVCLYNPPGNVIGQFRQNVLPPQN